MGLSTSGKISVNDILGEMGRPLNSAGSNLQELAARWKENTGKSKFDPPHRMSDWRGESWIVDHDLSITPVNMGIPNEGMTFSVGINVQANAAWAVTIETGTGVTSIGPTLGRGHSTFQVTIAENTEGNSRQGTISVATSQEAVTLIWVQEAGDIISPIGGGGPGGGLGGGGGSGGGGTGGGDTGGGGSGDDSPGFG